MAPVHSILAPSPSSTSPSTSLHHHHHRHRHHALSTDGFRAWLQRAVRADEQHDWTPHAVDYGLFKARLKGFAHRRAHLRHLLRESNDERLSEPVLNAIVEKPPKRIDFQDDAADPTSAVTPHQQQSSKFSSPATTTTSTATPEASSNNNDPHPILVTDYQAFHLLTHPQNSGSYSDTDNESVSGAGGGAGGGGGHHRTSAAGAVPAEVKANAEDVGGGGSGGNSSVSGLFHFVGQPRRISKRSIWRRVSNAERQEMVSLLTWELEKCCMFYLVQWQHLSRQVELGSSSGAAGGGGGTSATSANCGAAGASASILATAFPDDEVSRQRVGDEILELLAFCVTNVVAVRQILIRYDAFARTFGGTPLLNYYMKHALKHPTGFRKLLYHEELSAIADAYAQQEDLESLSSFVDLTQQHPGSYSTHSYSSFGLQRQMFHEILASSESAASVASTGHQRLTDTFIHTVRNWYLLGAFEDHLGLEPSYLTMRGQSLTKEIQQLAEWRQNREQRATTTATPSAAPAMGAGPRERDDLDIDDDFVKSHHPPRLTGMQVYHLTLNLISGFLYCMNYYIVEPSSTMYVNRLGAYDALSGTLIGMMPLAAFCSSIPYSMWTNRSFRHPFIMSCCLLIVGNVTYALADHFSHVSMALAGRFICGLGAPKCIIRRYMADTTPMSLRTSVNAGFGMVVAAGSALGPAMAVLLNRIDYTWHAPYFGFLFFNGLTLPGWFMACLWTTFFVIVLATFEEPDRQGLQEQREREEDRGVALLLPGSPSTLGSTLSVGDHDELRTIFSGEDYESVGVVSSLGKRGSRLSTCWSNVRNYLDLITFPVRICLGLLFAKVFTIEALVSATSALTKNRYRWNVQQVGTLGFTNGLLVIPFSILVGRLSMSYQDHVLMRGLVATGSVGLFLLIDVSDLRRDKPNNRYYNQGQRFAVGPRRYIAGYFLSYLSIQAFEGVIGSTLSKVIPTALASGTLNSGLLATLVDTLGRASGDLFISAMGYLNLRQLMNLLFIPTFTLMLICLLVIERFRDLLCV